MGKIYKVVVFGVKGEKITIDLCNTEEQMQKITLGQFKEKLLEAFNLKEWTENMRLIFADKMLEGDTTLLSDYGIQHFSVIHMALKLSGGGYLPPPSTDGLGDKEGDTRRSMECLKLDL